MLHMLPSGIHVLVMLDMWFALLAELFSSLHLWYIVYLFTCVGLSVCVVQCIESRGVFTTAE